MHHISPEMKQCIDNCLACYSECLSMAMGHCLEKGGQHTEQTLQADDGLRRNLPHLGPFHADRHRAPQAHLPRVRGNMPPVRRRLRTGR